MKAYYRPYKAEDFPEVLDMKLRELDIEEMQALLKVNTRQGLHMCLMESVKTWVIIYKGKIEGIFGLGYDGICGIPWFMATNKFDGFSYQVAKQSKQIIKMFLDIYPYLENIVYANHFVAKRWLKWLGFTIEEGCIWIGDKPFQKFYMKKE